MFVDKINKYWLDNLFTYSIESLCVLMIDINEREKYILDYWEKEKPTEKLKRQRVSNKKFYFLDGPPYATGDLGTHHVWVAAVKDLVLRYKRYRGFYVHDRAGFDVHGLPIENKVEKLLKIKNKSDIENRIGIEKFVKECKTYANEQIHIAIPILKEFGSSLDFDTVYLPYKDEYIEKGWKILKDMHNKNLLYKGENVLAYCSHCETVLSAQGPEVEYEDVEDLSIFVEYKIIENQKPKIDIKDNTYLVIWTTTPWTLISNMAIAVNPDAIYVIAKFGDKRYIIAKDRFDDFSTHVNESAIIESEVYGSELSGLKYISPLSEKVPKQLTFSKYHKVIMGKNFVNTSEGTGILHVAPAHGPDDFKLGKTNKLPIFSPIDSHARYTDEAGEYSGLLIPTEANTKIIQDLAELGSLVYTKKIKHSYPHCWRCSSKLIYNATRQWFINIQKLKKKMIKANEKVIWHPDKAKEWMRETINSSPDWCISRQRYWGTPIPIWECINCSSITVIGSVKELEERSSSSHNIKNLHRPHIDSFEIKCSKCGSASKRIKDVFDVWYDSGISHIASLSDDELKILYPANWISEGRDQLRGWFSSLMRTGIAIYNKSPFEEVTIGGMVFDELGIEMHRHLGNAILAKDLRNIVSSDGFRIWCSSRPRWQDIKLNKKDLLEGNNNIITLYNIAELLKEFSLMCDFDTHTFKSPSKSILRIEDKWIISKLNSLIKKITEKMDVYNIDSAIKDMREFLVEDISRVYLKFFKKRAESANNIQLLRLTNIFAYIMYNTLILFSIVIPFSTEFIYLELFSKNNSSIFMNMYPKVSKQSIDPNLEKQFEIVNELSTAILNLREKEKIKLRQPLNSVTIESNSDKVLDTVKELSSIVESLTNIKSVKIIKTERISKEIKPIFPKLGPIFKGNAQIIGEELAKMDPDRVINSIDEHGVYRLHTSSGTFDIKNDYFSIVEKPISDNALEFKYGVVSLNTQITKELKEELITRDLIRNIQSIRKDMGLNRTIMIELYITTSSPISEIITKNNKQIKRIVRAKKLEISEPSSNVVMNDIYISGTKVSIKITKLE